MEKTSIFGRVMTPIFDGRHPWIWLIPTSKAINEDRLRIEGGIVPNNLFEAVRKKFKLSQSAKRIRDNPTQVIIMLNKR